MKKSCIVLVFFVVISSFLYGQTKLIVGLTEYPPLTTGTMSGYGAQPQMIAESLKGKSYSIEYQFFPYSRLLSEINQTNKSVDGVLMDAKSADKTNLYTKAIMTSQVVFFYKKSRYPQGLQFTDLSDLASYRVGIPRGSSFIERLEQAGMIVDQASDEVQDLKKLQADRIDISFALDIAGWHVLKETGANLNDYAVTKPLASVDSVIAIFKSTPNAEKIIEDISTGYEAAKKEGRLLRILETYYGKGNVPDSALP